ncbi:MAG: hypothetical protein KA247_07885, partial [Bacteroidetes bacterium]|nr:hypothetical protein [Bacteroidota bacterium]
MILCSVLSAQTVNVKCGTFTAITTRLENRMVKVESASAARPSLHRSVLTKNQKIRIHYDTSGTNL